jgi:hypothetical protein
MEHHSRVSDGQILLLGVAGHVEGLKGIIKVGHKLEQLLVLGVFPVP